jgi:hypothetical protein
VDKEIQAGVRGEVTMSGGGIYLIQDDGEPVEMTEQEYAAEDLLQELLAKHPNLLAGDQMSSGEPRRWLLISREMGVPAEEDGGDQWSVDHLFLDQDAIPTIVEVKRSTDTRIRREVVGQMLDYAANAVVYWPVDRLRIRFEEGHEDPEQELMNLLNSPDADPDDFWQRVKTNLQAGRVRLVFVADKIPTELRRVVEFLNQQMDPAEVLAVEIKQYAGQESSKVLTSRIIGQTEEALQKKAATTRYSRRWDEPSFFGELERQRGPYETEAARRILDWIKDNSFSFHWGKTSFNPTLSHGGLKHQIIGIYTNGVVEVKFALMRDKSPFEDEEKRKELRHRLNEIPGVDLPADRMNRYPTFPLSALKDEPTIKQFLEVLDWFVQEVKAT